MQGCALLFFTSPALQRASTLSKHMSVRPSSMEPATARTFESPANEVWDPSTSIPLEYASSIDIFAGISSLQPYVPSSSSRGQQQQLVQYNYYAAATQYDGPTIEKAAAAQESLEVDLLHNMEMEIYNNNPILVFQEAARKFKEDIGTVKTKIHRYPPSIQALGGWCTVPRIVAIGPYHRGRQELIHAENVKHAAAYHCINTSGRSVQEMYYAVVSAVVQTDARSLYSKDVMEGIGDDDFLPLMFFDACFLVMYMLKVSGMECNATLYDFFVSSDSDIAHDIMLLENQIPWPAVEAVMKYTALPLAEFIAKWKDGCLQDRVDEAPSIVLDDSYQPPHLLGLLRFHIVGRRRRSRTEVPAIDKMRSIPVSVSAIELAEMGINLRANKTAELADMELTKKRIFFAELSMAPLSLSDLRASLLVNMAAHELCTTPDFFDADAEFEDSAVCSYLLLCMLVHREEDVHQLRRKGILQGGAGLTNTKALDFFTSLQSLRLGRCCGYVMVQIESYRINRPMRIKVYAFIRSNWKNILGVFSAIAVFASILKAINSLKGAH